VLFLAAVLGLNGGEQLRVGLFDEVVAVEHGGGPVRGGSLRPVGVVGRAAAGDARTMSGRIRAAQANG
jgi:hypothetical protein